MSQYNSNTLSLFIEAFLSEISQLHVVYILHRVRLITYFFLVFHINNHLF